MSKKRLLKRLKGILLNKEKKIWYNLKPKLEESETLLIQNINLMKDSMFIENLIIPLRVFTLALVGMSNRKIKENITEDTSLMN